MNQHQKNLIGDILIITASIVVAVFIVKNGWMERLLISFQGSELFGGFISGIFFTSIFTTIPATAMLGEIMQQSSILAIAAVGAAGSLIGDLIIFRFVRDNVSEDLHFLFQKIRQERLSLLIHSKFFQLKVFRWLIPLFGALIVLSPLPDEIGLTILGLSKMRLRVMIPLTYCLNFIGIVIIGLVARAI